MTAETAEAGLDRVLAAMAGPGARPRPDQVEAVAALLEGRRVLLVQATGWGKSAVYWAATGALRAAGRGPTLVISPLLALMRDQVDAAAKAGLRGATVNSANVEDWQQVFDALAADELDVLLVSPERLANPRFADRALPLLAKAGMLVVDEAHCISDWGFDFRPDYQRLTQLLARTTEGSPVLATTATANARVTDDVAAQLRPRSRPSGGADAARTPTGGVLGAADTNPVSAAPAALPDRRPDQRPHPPTIESEASSADTLVLRGPLARASLRLAVVPGLDGVERFGWVAGALEALPGSGIVYALTVDQATSLAGFLAAQGHRVAAYTGQTEPEERARIEAVLRANEVKAVVATSALGMGYDKPDLGFCVHVGSPDSPVAYYQQVGRAGRALDTAVGVLLPAAESDPRIWDYFATATIPDPDAARRVLALLPPAGGEPMSLPSIEAETGLRRGRLEALLKTLRVDGAVDRVGSGWVGTGVDWHYDAERYGRIVKARRVEADLMRTYAAGARCLMQVLTEALDDPAAGVCGRCSVCTGELPFPGARPAPDRVAAARRHLRGRQHLLEPRKLWPSGGSRRGRITGIVPGRSVAFADDPGWLAVTAELAGPDAEPGGELREALVDVLRRWSTVWDDRPRAIVPVPSRSHPLRVTGMAAHLAEVGRLPLLDVLRAVGRAPDDGVSSGVRVRQLLDGLSRDEAVPLPAGPVLLVDDVARTGWTLTVAAALLRDGGTGPVLPLVGHRRP